MFFGLQAGALFPRILGQTVGCAVRTADLRFGSLFRCAQRTLRSCSGFSRKLMGTARSFAAEAATVLLRCLGFFRRRPLFGLRLFRCSPLFSLHLLILARYSEVIGCQRLGGDLGQL